MRGSRQRPGLFGGARSLPPSERACDGLVAALAAWTLACHAVVAAGGSLHALLGLASAVGIGLGGLAFARRRAARGDAGEAAREAGEGSYACEPTPPPPAPAWGLIATALAGGIGLPLLAASGAGLRAVWGLGSLYLGAVAIWTWGRRATPAPPVRSAGSERALWGLGVLGALIPLFVHRRSLDDVYYLNVSVHAADAPSAPLLAADSLHGIDGLPLLLPVYKVNSFELLGAALAYLSPLDAIDVVHLVLPALFGLCVPLAYAQLLRQLAPQTWLGSLCVVVALLLGAAEGTEFWGNFAFVRLHQGKCVFLSVLLPLLLAFGLRFGARPDLRNGLLLAAAQIASVGLTTTAIWVAPVVAALGVAAPLRLERSSLRTLLLGLGTSTYVLGVGAVVALLSSRSLGGLGSFDDVERLFSFSFRYMLGTGPVAWACFGAALSAWGFCRDPVARRVCVGMPLAVALLFLNPFTAMWVAKTITSFPTYYRVLWLLPVPAFLALILSAPLGWTRLPTPLRAAIVAGATAAFVWFAPTLHVLSARNHVRIAAFQYNVPPEEFRAAAALVERVPPGSYVLAPEVVSHWVVTLHDHPYPLVPRAHYLNVLRDHFEANDRRLRLALTEYVAGRWHSAQAPVLLAQAIDHYRLSGVGLIRAHPRGDEIRGVLRAHGFSQTWNEGRYELWTRGTR